LGRKIVFCEWRKKNMIKKSGIITICGRTHKT